MYIIKGNRLCEQKERYLFVFLASFIIFAAILLPLIIYNKGYFLYYGDFNSQQLMFYQHCHDFIRENGFGWDWGTDLGSDFIGSYSFYLLGSPFFWLTVPFPSEAVLYIFPWLLCLKTAVAALTSYAFLRRFIKTPDAAAIGAMLYAFSGAQIYNVFFNHFHDVTALFPLILLALEMRVQDNKRGVFALAVALNAFVNYYFFASTVVFTIIYFIIRCTDKSFRLTKGKFLSLAIEAITGVMISAVLFLPAALAVLGNPRMSESLFGMDMAVYGDKFRLYRIIQSLFMLPDMPARSNLFSSDTARWASIAAYLPMFSMAGVIAFMRKKKKHWAGKLAVICLICALVPILNSAFQLFNGTYYARWFFMPTLIMALMTAYAIDDADIDIKDGIPFVTVVLVIFCVLYMLPVKNEDGSVTIGNVAKYPDLAALQLSVTILVFASLVFVAYFMPDKRSSLKHLLRLTAGCCFVCAAAMIWYGVAQGPHNDYYIEHAINGEIELPEEEDQFFRIDTSENVDNWTMFWGYSSVRCFQSTVSPSIMSFYDDTMGITRNVATRADPQYYGLRSILSVKYYLDEKDGKQTDIAGGRVIGSQNNFDIIENEYYIPMGFVYDKYVNIDIAEKLSTAQKSNLAVQAVMLTDEQIEKYSDIMEDYGDYYNGASRDDIAKEAAKKRETACYYFKPSEKGFEARIKLDKESLVFFSVPYDKGFTAYINGTETQIDEVFGGLSAVRVPAGDSEIVFKYETAGLKQGIIISICGIILFAAYMVCGALLSSRKRNGDDGGFSGCVYDYQSLCDLTDGQAEESFSDGGGTESAADTANERASYNAGEGCSTGEENKAGPEEPEEPEEPDIPEPKKGE